jgi:hypothetical protein
MISKGHAAKMGMVFGMTGEQTRQIEAKVLA